MKLTFKLLIACSLQLPLIASQKPSPGIELAISEESAKKEQEISQPMLPESAQSVARAQEQARQEFRIRRQACCALMVVLTLSVIIAGPAIGNLISPSDGQGMYCNELNPGTNMTGQCFMLKVGDCASCRNPHGGIMSNPFNGTINTEQLKQQIQTELSSVCGPKAQYCINQAEHLPHNCSKLNLKQFKDTLQKECVPQHFLNRKILKRSNQGRKK